ncbi:hypothetical protein [Streptomyces sp. NPDC004270]
MHLVHIFLLPHPRGVQLPGHTAGLVAASVAPGDSIEHVSVHPRTLPFPVVGVYVRANTLETAEASATAAWQRASQCDTELREWHFLCAQGVPKAVDMS